MLSYDDVKRILESLKGERESYDSHWRELQKFFSPRRTRHLADSEKSRGNKVNQALIDPTPRFAARVLAAGMHAGSTNPSMPWFKLATPDPELNEYGGVARWLYAVENRMRAVFDRSNVYSVLPTLYGDAGVFGTGSMTILEHPTKVIHCVPSPVGSYYLGTNDEGIVDTKYCEYKMTAVHMAQHFGEGKLPEMVKNALRQKKNSAYFDIVHAIQPNSWRSAEDYSAAHMPFASVYYTHDQSKTLLRASGFEDNPLATFRWETTEITDPYGSSPGMDALGCSKAMQVQQRQKGKAIDKHVDPPMVADATLQQTRSSLLPGDVTYAGFTATGSAPRFQPAYVIKPELAGLLEDIADIRQLVQTAMYTDLFLAITMANPRNATAAEIVERREEKVLMLGPTLQNHKDGIINPLIDRTFYIMMRQGLLPPPPPELEGVPLKVEMVGLLAQSLKAVQSSGIERFAGFVGQMAKMQADAGEAPTAFDKLDIDQSIDEFAQAIGVPPTMVRDDNMVAAVREQRAQAQQQQQEMAMAQPVSQAAKAAKDLSETELGEGNALEALTGG